jgi:MFS family permease
MSLAPKQIVRLALYFALLVGIVNLFADFTYEGARSINGAFLASLGSSAAVVGLVAGLGELIGYGLRSLTGLLADKTRRYWTFAFIGYAINMLAVPALALAGSWPLAAGLMIAERTGRAIRKPAMETMLSHSGKILGQGWVFGLHEFLDQFGAALGPLVVAWVLFHKGGYQAAYGILLVSALLCLILLALASHFFPAQHFQKKETSVLPAQKFSRSYWLYVAAGAFAAAGFADFSLAAFHFQKTGEVALQWIPIFYAWAMICGGFSALLFGKLFDKFGAKILLLAFFLGSFSAPLIFLGQNWMIVVGLLLWGIGLGAQDSLLKAALVGLVPQNKIAAAFGVFDTGFGVAWFLGSAVLGILYAKSILWLVLFSVVFQLAALPWFSRALKTGQLGRA